MALALLCWAIRYPIMLMLSITGLVMLFDDEIELAFHQDAIEIAVSGEPIKVSQQLATAQNQYPQGSVTQFVPVKHLIWPTVFGSMKTERPFSPR